MSRAKADEDVLCVHGAMQEEIQSMKKKLDSLSSAMTELQRLMEMLAEDLGLNSDMEDEDFIDDEACEEPPTRKQKKK